MKTEEAERLSLHLLRISAHLDQSIGFVRDHDDNEVFLEYRKATGKVMGDLYLDVMEPLWKRFPNLRPTQDGGTYELGKNSLEPFFYRKEKPRKSPINPENDTE